MRAAVLAALLALAAAGSLPGQRTLLVPSQYATIQAAIDAARTSDTVLVSPGTYKENLDFKGKAITVTSLSGPDRTVIDGNQRASAVRFASGEARTTVLSGFTITRGNASVYGGGVYCLKASPTLTSNHIVRNYAGAFGGGIHCDGAAPLVLACRIAQNVSGAHGGGVSMVNASSPEVTNTFLEGNSAVIGGGFYIGSGATQITNVTVYRNTGSFGGGLYISGGTPAVVNGIVWNNSASTGPEIHVVAGTLQVSYSDVKGGQSGPQNINLDPVFVDPTGKDFHLQSTSPCNGTGTASAPRLPATDFEGDPRNAFGAVDMGADEFAVHLYVTGNATPGGAIEAKTVGLPGSAVILGVGSGVLSPPLPVPGLQGMLHLSPPIGLLPLGSLGLSGVVKLPFRFPATFPVGVSIPLQSLVANELTNLHVLHVK